MDFALARHNMIESQIRTNKVTDQPLIDVLETLEREAFVPDSLKPMAYVDEDVGVAPGRIMMEPRVLARLLQAARIEENDLALVIAAASGYEAATVSRLAGAVVALESDEKRAEAVAQNLIGQGAETASVVVGPLNLGYAEQAPYDVIFINGAVDELPDALITQLAEGGRLVYIQTEKKSENYGVKQGLGRAVLVTKMDGVVTSGELFDAAIPTLPEFAGKAEFSF